MRLFNLLKVAVLTAVVGCALAGCSGDKGKVRYVPVVLDGEEKWSILDTKTGDILCENDFEYQPSVVEDGLFVVRTKAGYYQCYKVDDSKNVVSKGKFTQLGAFGDEGVTFAVKEGKGIIIVDKSFDEVKKLPKDVTATVSFSDGLAAFCKDGKWGFLDTKGEVAIPAKFDQVMSFAEGRALALKGDKIHIIDKKGATVKSFSQDKYELLHGGYHNGYMAVVKGSKKIVFLDKSGEEKFANSKLENDDFHQSSYLIDDGKMVYCKDGSFGIITTDGEVLVRPKYKALQYAGKNRYLALRDDGKCGVIDAKGEKVIGFDYDNIAQISTASDRYFALEGKTWVLINEKGEEQTKDSFKDVNLNVDNMQVFYSEAAMMDTNEPLEPDMDSVAYDYDDEVVGYADSAY